jgi:hypothetical protein
VEPNPFDRFVAPDRPPDPTLIPVAELSERITRILAESRRAIDATQVVLARGWVLLDRYRPGHNSTASVAGQLGPDPSNSTIVRGGTP